MCERELIELRESIKKDVEAGKIEESHFMILDKKIGDYLDEMKAEKDGKGSDKENKRKGKGKGSHKRPPKEIEEPEDLEDFKDTDEPLVEESKKKIEWE